MRRSLAWFASTAVALTAAAALAGNGSHPSLVPWKVIEPGSAPERAPLVLFWVPSSRDELRRSELLTSDALTLYSSQCVAMRIVRLDDRAMLERLGVDEVPVVVLTNADGEVLARGDGTSVAVAESMVRDELEARAEAAEALLDEARAKAAAGERDAAIAIYRDVWDQRCVCPRQARAAHKALKRLGK